MAGTNAGFNPATFRTAIRSAMTMGLPSDLSERATFRWTTVKAYTTHDVAGKPYEWDTTPAASTAHADVQVPCSIQFSARPAGTQETTLGEFDNSRVVLTILDDDYDQVRTADLVVLGGNTYNIEFVAPPIGLFEVTVYQVYLLARDES